MRIPVMQGVIERRILANFHVDADVMARLLPPPFRPQLVKDKAMAGICLIRLIKVRPKFFPIPIGIRSENAAHRIAVQWTVNGKDHHGVYIPRRDTNSRLNTWAGGTLFPGEHHHASFTVMETADHLSVSLASDDGTTTLHVSGKVSDTLPRSSLFANLSAASEFFARGSLGYSATSNAARFDGLELCCSSWSVNALDVERISSSFFDDPKKFPPGSVEFDCALLMRNIPHEWHSREDLFADSSTRLVQ